MNKARKATAVAAALAALAMAAPAAASITFNVSGAFDWMGTPLGAISGTFTTNDAATQVTAVNLTTSAFGDFQAFTYDQVADIDAQWLPQYFRLTVGAPRGLPSQLQIWFDTPLHGLPANSFAISGFEEQGVAGNRMLKGTAAVAAAAVPEPRTWALLIAGFGLAGWTLRGRRTAPASA